jgi:hypothetical protein
MMKAEVTLNGRGQRRGRKQCCRKVTEYMITLEFARILRKEIFLRMF